jgi:ATP/ADP translocase
MKYSIVVPVAVVVILLLGYAALPETSFRIFLVVLATNALVLAIFCAAIIMLNRQVDQMER